MENNFNLLNMSLKNYIEELLPYLYSHSYLNLKYVLDLEDFKVDIGTMAYLGIMIYEFLFNVLSYDIMEKKYTNVSITLRREKNNGILRIRNEYGDLDNPNRKDLNIISYQALWILNLSRKVAKMITQSHSQYQTTSLAA